MLKEDTLGLSDFDIASGKCVEGTSIEDDGEVLGVFLLLSINHWNAEQERMVVLTERAVYRMNYNFDDKVIVSKHRTALEEIKRIVWGSVMWPDKVAMHILRNGASRSGVRIYTSLDEPGFLTRWNPAATQDFSTFVSYPDFRPDEEEDGHKSVESFQSALQAAVLAANTTCDVQEGSIKLDAITGLTAKFRNELTTSFRGTRLAETERNELKQRETEAASGTDTFNSTCAPHGDMKPKADDN